MWRCRIPLEPMGKQRPRIAVRGPYAKAYTPTKTMNWEKDAAVILRARWRKAPFSDPTRVVIRAFRSRTQYMNAKCRREISTCVSKPDIDNIAKIVLDSLVRAGVIADDNQVVSLECTKQWAVYGENGFVEVAIESVVD